MKLLIFFGLVVCTIIFCTAEDKCNHRIGQDGKRECFLCKAAYAPVCTKNKQDELKTFPNNCSICVYNCNENAGKVFINLLNYFD